MQSDENAIDVIEKERPFDRSSNRYFPKIFRKLTFVPTMAIVIGIAWMESAISFAQSPATDQAPTDTVEPSIKSRKSRQETKGKGGATAKSKDMAKSRSGPIHRFEIEPPVRDFDVILSRPTESSVTVSVMTQKPMEVSVRYGVPGANEFRETQIRTMLPDRPAEWILEGLEPDRQYEYELRVRKKESYDFETISTQSFRTARKPGSTFAFAIQADSHLDQATRVDVYEKTLSIIRSEKPDFFVDLGDTFMTDKYPNFRDAMPQYLAQRYFLGQVARSAPLFLVLGNHDGERGDRFDGGSDSMPGWSNALRKQLFPNPEPDRFYTGNDVETKPLGRLQNYYAWTWGDAILIVLDPFWPTRERVRGDDETDANWSRTLGESQYRWFKKTLETSHSKYKFVFIHHLVGGLDRSARGGAEAARSFEWGGRSADGSVDFPKRRPGWDMPIHDLLVKHQVSAVFHGHDHFYARQSQDGVAYVLVPQPGHPGGGNVEKSAERYGYETGVIKSSPGHVLVRVTPDQATVEFVKTEMQPDRSRRQSGEVAGDQFSIRPHHSAKP